MKLYKQYYVSVKPDSELAYVLPLTGGEKKIALQKSKGESWAKSYNSQTREYVSGGSFTLDNEPTSGYEVIGFSSRYSTSNKHIYLKHPKGFHFEMTVETFVEMIKEVTVEYGVIKDDLIMYTYNGKNALCVYGGNLYDTLEEDGAKYLSVDSLVTGDVITLKGKSKLGNKVTYLGKRKLSADIEILYNTDQLVDVSSNDYSHYWTKAYEKDQKLNTSTAKVIVHLFLLESKEGNTTLFSYSEAKKIKVVNVLGNEFVSDDFILSKLEGNSYMYSKVVGNNYYSTQRKVLLALLSQTHNLSDKVWNSLSYLDVKLKSVYLEDCNEQP